MSAAPRPISAQLRRGFPREANSVVEVGGVRTLFRMPDLLSIGLGGGSIVERRTRSQSGPQSVGYRLTREGVVFGGQTMTATDAAVAAGLVEIGDPEVVLCCRASLRARSSNWRGAKIEDAVDRMKTEAGDLPLIAVGGGAFLVPDRLAGISQVIRVAARRLRQCGRRRDRADQRRDRPGLSRLEPR